MTAENDMVGGVPRFPLPLLEAQADLVEKHKVETLLFCPEPWALRHVFINQDTGEVVRARCNRWDCLFCGPRKVDQWRQLVKATEALKAWFEALLADWVDKMAVGRRVDSLTTKVFSELIQNVYGLIVWEHVARAFRPNY